MAIKNLLFPALLFLPVPTIVSAQENPSAVPESPPPSLSFSRAVEKAVHANLATLLARADSEEARGRALESASSLLPRVLGSVSQSRIFKVNLEAQGFPANNALFGPLIGPFNNFDARLRLVQTIFDWSAIKGAGAGRLNAAAAELNVKLAEEQVVSAVALAYIDVLRAQANVHAAQADTDLAKSLFTLAEDRRKAGLSTGIDAARAETQFAQARLRLITAGLASRQAEIRLLRLAGEPLSESVRLTDELSFSTVNFSSPDAAVHQALSQRWEIRIAEERVKGNTAAYRSARSGWWPALSGTADYGLSGNDPGNAEKTGSIGARLDLPLFTGGQIRGRTLEARARLRRAEAQADDWKRQVEEDVRLALEMLSAEVREVETSSQVVDLAQRELRMAQERFSAGVGDNIQLVAAQTALSRAREDQVNALARYHVARLNYAMALGEARSFTL